MITKGASVKWRFISLALGFKYSALEIIGANIAAAMSGPQTVYTLMLSDWLSWAPPNHPHPTSTALAAALRNEMVEEHILATAVEERFGGGERNSL